MEDKNKTNVIREKLFLHETGKFYTIAMNFFNKTIEPTNKKSGIFHLNRRRFDYMYLSYHYMLKAFLISITARDVVIQFLKEKETK